MEDSTKHGQQDEDVKLPWQSELEVKDLIRPIRLRRIRIYQAAGTMAAILVIGLFAWWLFIKPPSGESIVKDMIAAAGGMKHWQSIQDGSFVRIHRRYDENGKVVKQSRETFYFRNAPDERQLLIKSLTNEGDQVIVGRDKGGFWASMNDNEVEPKKIAKELEFMCDGDECSPLCASEMALYKMSFPFKLADYGVKPRNAGTAVLNGETALLLDVTFDPKVGKDRWIFYVDPSTKLIRKIEHYPTLKDNVQPEEMFLSDFKKEGPIMLSHSNKFYRSNGKILEEYLVSDVKFNSAITSEFFSRQQQFSSLNK